LDRIPAWTPNASAQGSIDRRQIDADNVFVLAAEELLDERLIEHPSSSGELAL
jgi:hypothetical protein